jgi:hypothetical protein
MAIKPCGFVSDAPQAFLTARKYGGYWILFIKNTVNRF